MNLVSLVYENSLRFKRIAQTLNNMGGGGDIDIVAKEDGVHFIVMGLGYTSIADFYISKEDCDGYIYGMDVKTTVDLATFKSITSRFKARDIIAFEFGEIDLTIRIESLEVSRTFKLKYIQYNDIEGDLYKKTKSYVNQFGEAYRTIEIPSIALDFLKDIALYSDTAKFRFSKNKMVLQSISGTPSSRFDIKGDTKLPKTAYYSISPLITLLPLSAIEEDAIQISLAKKSPLTIRIPFDKQSSYTSILAAKEVDDIEETEDLGESADIVDPDSLDIGELVDPDEI